VQRAPDPTECRDGCCVLDPTALAAVRRGPKQAIADAAEAEMAFASPLAAAVAGQVKSIDRFTCRMHTLPRKKTKHLWISHGLSPPSLILYPNLSLPHYHD